MSSKTTSDSPAAEKAQDKAQEARKRNLDLAISQIHKEFGESAIMRMGDEHRVDVDVIPTGNLLIDRALGVGGFPRGRIVEVYGRNPPVKPRSPSPPSPRRRNGAGWPRSSMSSTRSIRNMPASSASIWTISSYPSRPLAKKLFRFAKL